ncbi:MAG: hypothetical protein K6E96_08510 [Bacteroidales bacterium]|nr:hypothetical protein [Bacteroidales bacterium]
MKKSILTVLFCLTAYLLQAQNEAAVTVEDNFQRLQVSFTTGELHVGKTEINRQTFSQLSIDGMLPSAQVGAPCLPTWSALIEVPVCSGYEVEVSGVEYDTLEFRAWSSDFGVIVPVQPSRSKSDTESHPLTMDEKIYSSDVFYASAPLATVEPVGMARDRNLARLQFSPVSYNPVSGTLVVCRQATVTVHYTGADERRSMELFERYHSPAFGFSQATFNNLYPKSVHTAAPVRYLIVAHSMFHGQLDNFINWKRRKGFITDIVYTDDAGVGTTSTSIAAYIKGQYDNATAAKPAPTYLLIVGDHEQIPAFAAQVTSPSNDHITDLYYATWTSGDIIPDCYMGRFSAQSVAQLTPQIEKTLMYEQYTFADPTFLDRAVMVAGVDGGSSGDYGYTHADPAMDYAITNYVNGAHGFSQVMYFKNNTSIVPTGSNVTVGSSASSNSATVRNYYNQGAGWINYSAHGSATSWGTPNFTTSHASSMTNTQKFGIMIGNCCLTNKFETTTCLGEALLRKGSYCGAVGYIGGSNSTYWSEDFYWAVGIRSGIGPAMSMAYNSSNLGAYDRLFHTHNESQDKWATSQGSIMMLGNMAVQGSTSGYKNYYWEIYHLMGDPSVMPYLTQAPAMTLTANSVITAGATTLPVTTVAYAYVALTDTLTRTLRASGYADASGHITLTLPTTLPVGGYELAASAQQYQTAFKSLSVVPSSGPYPAVIEIVPTASLAAGGSIPLRISVANLGNSDATGVTVALTTDCPFISLSSSSINIGNLHSGDTTTITTVTVTASSGAPDATQAYVTATTQWSGSTAQSSFESSFTINSALITMDITPSSSFLLPDNNLTVTIHLSNIGHATLGTSMLTLTTGNPLLTVSSTGSSFTLAQGANLTRQFQLHAAATIDTNILVPIYVHLGGAMVMDDTLLLFIGRNTTETFEGGQFQLQGWVQGDNPWVLTSNEAYEGSYSARSAENLAHSNTSEMYITVTTTSADSVSFYYKVSSESNYDKFYFHLDGVEMIVASGEVNWTRAAFPIAAGTHELLFNYTKDYSVSSGADCAWIDNVALPHGSNPGNSGDNSDDGTYENLTATFESASYDSRWTLVGGDLTNVWTIGTAAANNSNRGLYISNNGGTSNEYNGTSPSSVFAYTTVWLEEGNYETSFDWRCNGESDYDYLRAALLRGNGTLMATTTAASNWSTTTLPSTAIAIDGGQRLNQSSNWQTKTVAIHINQRGWYRLVFYWRNDNSVANTPPAAIDNVMLTRVVEYRTVTVTAEHGTPTGAGTYELGQTATVGVYPEVGYTFVGWEDGNINNPRELVVNNNISLHAILTQGTTDTIHDTTYFDVFVHDTTVITQVDTVTLTEYVPVHDTTYIDVFVHDTTVVTQVDTLTLTEYVPVHDTTYIDVFVHDTTMVTQVDTLTLTEYIAVHDTTIQNDTIFFPVYLIDTTYVPVHDTTTLYDTLTLIEYFAVHDTTIQRDTIFFPVYQFDTTYVTVHDTTTLYDTLTLTEYVAVHDTTIQRDTIFFPVYQFDTTYVLIHDTSILYDTLTITEYVAVHDTTWLDVLDTLWIRDTMIVDRYIYDTITEYVSIHDTTIQRDTLFVPVYLHDTSYVAVHDTTTLYDTLTLTEYVQVHDTTIQRDTLFVPVYLHDTSYVAVHDTTTLYDTLTFTEYIQVHDTTIRRDTLFVPVYLHDTSYVAVHDTTTLYDTLMLTEYVPVHDTTILTLTDTVLLTEYVPIHDTTILTLTDTVLLTEYVPVHDTTILTLTDTVLLTEYIPIHDTTFIDVFVYDTTLITLWDTIVQTEYVPVHDTTILTLTDTVITTIYDTITNTVIDTIDNFIYDTTIVTDTLWLTHTDTLVLHDTIFLYDTVFVYDTIYITEQGIDGADAINLKVYSSYGQIVVEGANGRQVTLYDVVGRALIKKQDEYTPLKFDVPASGTYLIKAGELPARRIVAIR